MVASRRWALPDVPELETGDYYPLHPHSRMLNRVKVHPQMIVENAADPYHIAPVHHGDRPAETTSFELHDYHLHATVDVNYGGGRPTTWLTPNGPVDGEVVYDTFGLGIGFVRFPGERPGLGADHRPHPGRRGVHRLLVHHGVRARGG